MMPELYKKWGEEESYISLYKKHHAQLEDLMKLGNNESLEAANKAWAGRNPDH